LRRTNRCSSVEGSSPVLFSGESTANLTSCPWHGAQVRGLTEGRRSQPRDLSGDLRRDHNLRDDNDRLGWGRRQAQNGGSPEGDRWVESISLQRRVCKLSVPLLTASLWVARLRVSGRPCDSRRRLHQ